MFILYCASFFFLFFLFSSFLFFLNTNQHLYLNKPPNTFYEENKKQRQDLCASRMLDYVLECGALSMRRKYDHAVLFFLLLKLKDLTYFSRFPRTHTPRPFYDIMITFNHHHEAPEARIDSLGLQ